MGQGIIGFYADGLAYHEISQIALNLRFVDVTPPLLKMQISQSDITSFEKRSILYRCLQYL